MILVAFTHMLINLTGFSCMNSAFRCKAGHFDTPIYINTVVRWYQPPGGVAPRKPVHSALAPAVSVA